MADVVDRGRRRDEDADPEDPEDDVRILDDTAASEPVRFRRGDKFDVYHKGQSTKFVVTEIVERDGRRITYGEPLRAASDG